MGSGITNIGTHGPVIAWLLGSNRDLPIEVHGGRITKYHGSMFVSVAAGVNMILVSCAIAWRIPTLPFLLWAAFELVLAIARVGLLAFGQRAMANGRPPPISCSLALALGSSASVGYGAYLCVASQDWAASTLACLSAAAMVGSLCLRYFPMPRLVTSIIILSLGPCVAAALLAGEPILLVVALQLPLYAAIMTTAAIRLNQTMVRALVSERDNDRRAHHDPLTGLLNRAGLAREMNRRSADTARFALLYLDLDRFKAVNDSFGHQAGDELLKAVADRLRDSGRAGDAIARIGGDEFVILVAAPSIETARSAGQRFATAISGDGFFFGKEAAFIGVSIGIAFCPDHGRELGPLLGEADAALYQAKYSGRGSCVVARTGMQQGLVDDRKPVSYAVAQNRLLQDKAA